MNKNYKNIYQFKILLHEIEPEIWRLIEVPESYTFWELHVAIQDAMGWLDSHLHEFIPKGTSDVHIGIPEGPMDTDFVAGWTVPITQYFRKPGDAAIYEYDFGDGWSHEVELVAIEQRNPDSEYPKCLAGERACPPEDCGGVYGYYRILEILADSNDDEYEETIEWLSGFTEESAPYDPSVFDPKSVDFWDPEMRWKMMMDDGS